MPDQLRLCDDVGTGGYEDAGMMILPQIVGDNRLDGLILMGELDETYLKD